MKYIKLNKKCKVDEGEGNKNEKEFYFEKENKNEIII